MKRLEVLGVCAGNGASLLPFQKSKRFNVVANIEPRAIFHTLKNEQWVSNYPQVRLSRTILGINKVDVIIGHPDCGHSSILSKSTGNTKNPKENESMNIFFESIQVYKPKIWLMENLEALLETYPEEWFKKTFKRYNFRFIKAPVTTFGNSQATRKRLVIVATSKKISKMKLGFKKDFEPLTTGELIGDISGKNDILFGHEHEPLEKEVSLWWDGEKVTLQRAYELWNDQLKDSKTWPGYYNTKTQPGVYKLVEDLPPKTVRKQDRQFNHLGLPLTPREMARIQGIPDSFVIFLENGKKPQDLGYWVNKARATVSKCPPYELFTWFSRMLIKNYLK